MHSINLNKRKPNSLINSSFYTHKIFHKLSVIILCHIFYFCNNSHNKLLESKILQIIKYFVLLVDDESAQKRRNGLYGLASIAIAMYDYKGQNFVDFMVNPVLNGKICFTIADLNIAFGDREPKVQLAAWDAMFNILKYLR